MPPDEEVPFDPAEDLPEPGPAALPSAWTPDHVALRLLDAFRALDRLPRPKGPRAAGNHWPSHRVEFADQVAQAELPEAERRERAARRNALAFAPSGAQIARMDKVLDWLRAFREQDAEAALMLTLWGLRVARRRSVRSLCRERGWVPATFYNRRDRALDRLATQLNTRRVQVF